MRLLGVCAGAAGGSAEIALKAALMAAKDDGADTGIMPRKLGHVAFHTPDVAGTVKFYCDMLGFKVSDWRSDFFAFLREELPAMLARWRARR